MLLNYPNRSLPLPVLVSFLLRHTQKKKKKNHGPVQDNIIIAPICDPPSFYYSHSSLHSAGFQSLSYRCLHSSSYTFNVVAFFRCRKDFGKGPVFIRHIHLGPTDSKLVISRKTVLVHGIQG